MCNLCASGLLYQRRPQQLFSAPITITTTLMLQRRYVAQGRRLGRVRNYRDNASLCGVVFIPTVRLHLCQSLSYLSYCTSRAMLRGKT